MKTKLRSFLNPAPLAVCAIRGISLHLYHAFKSPPVTEPAEISAAAIAPA
jgi:hypothetical protein